eukprot:Sspe_Gene.5001::Locus_1643_Transcript_1_1_Confidence_1.000_Length_4473::g.5001::m.5001
MEYPARGPGAEGASFTDVADEYGVDDNYAGEDGLSALELLNQDRLRKRKERERDTQIRKAAKAKASKDQPSQQSQIRFSQRPREMPPLPRAAPQLPAEEEELDIDKFLREHEEAPTLDDMLRRRTTQTRGSSAPSSSEA